MGKGQKKAREARLAQLADEQTELEMEKKVVLNDFKSTCLTPNYATATVEVTVCEGYGRFVILNKDQEIVLDLPFCTLSKEGLEFLEDIVTTYIADYFILEMINWLYSRFNIDIY